MASKLESCHGWVLKSNPSIEEIKKVVPKLEAKLGSLDSEDEEEDYLNTITFLNTISDAMESHNISAINVLKKQDEQKPSNFKAQAIPRKQNERVVGGEHGLHAEVDEQVKALKGQDKMKAFAELKQKLGATDLKIRKAG